MSRIAIFASFDKKGIVHDYVITYLKRLKDIADRIIFIADNHASDNEKQKLNGLVDYAEFSPHGEYDFGSYKRGYQYTAKQGLLNEADELILCNDSCFCVSSLIPVFETMEKRNCDFWGMTKSHEIQDHLQSYFLVFKRNVFTSEVFINHLNNVTHKDDFADIVKCYELPFTQKLNNASFIESELFQINSKDNPTFYPHKTYKKGVPLIKRKVFTLKEATKESIRYLLMILFIKSRSSYKDIYKYYKITFSYLFPLLLPYSYNQLKKFLFQKKVTKSGMMCIKICKIPMFYKRIDREE